MIVQTIDEIRDEIRRLEVYLESRQYYSAPWEHQHNVLGTLSYLRVKEARLAAEIAAEEERTAGLVDRAQQTGTPMLAALLYVAFGAAVFTALAAARTEPAEPAAPAPAWIPTRTGYRPPNTFPKTLTSAKDRLKAAEDAFWDHTDVCDPCCDAAWGDARTWTMCGHGAPLWQALLTARDTVDNWSTYNRWFNRGGYERHLDSDWIAS